MRRLRGVETYFNKKDPPRRSWLGVAFYTLKYES